MSVGLVTQFNNAARRTLLLRAVGRLIAGKIMTGLSVIFLLMVSIETVTTMGLRANLEPQIVTLLVTVVIFSTACAIEGLGFRDLSGLDADFKRASQGFLLLALSLPLLVVPLLELEASYLAYSGFWGGLVGSVSVMIGLGCLIIGGVKASGSTRLLGGKFNLPDLQRRFPFNPSFPYLRALFSFRKRIGEWKPGEAFAPLTVAAVETPDFSGP